MINYTWEFPADAFEVYPIEGTLENVVKYIKWIRNADDGEHKVSYSATYNCANPNPQNYIPYNQLTKDLIIEWIESSLNLDAINGILNNMLNDQKSPKTEILPNPWQTIE